MKRNVLYILFVGCIGWITLASNSGGRANSGGADATIAGCSCHNGGNFSPVLASELLDGGTVVTEYTPGSSYTFSVTVSGSGSQTGFGMQSKALAGAAQAGTFTAGISANSQVSNIGGIEFPEQNGYSSTGVFQYTWVAPVASTGDVVFYLAGNAVNGLGTSGADGMATPITMTIAEAAAPVCSAPTNLTVTNITGTAADMSWTTGGAAIWETGIVSTGSGAPAAAVASITTTESLVGLAPGTTYDAYVRDVCATSLMISGVYDGPLSGGLPKGIELYAINDIDDLSSYGVGSANNGGGTDGQEFTFPSVSLTAGNYIYVTSDSAGFRDYFGFNADYISGSMTINGNDALELFIDGTVIDVYGDINVDGDGETWDYLDGWAYRNNGEVNNMGTFDDTKWTYSGANATFGCTTNGTCGSVYPNGTFTTSSDVSPWAGPETFTTPCITITPNETLNNVSCNGLSDGAIALAPTGGGTAYTYTWAGGQSTSALTGLLAGNYDVTVTNSGCSTEGSYTITEPIAMAISVTGINLSCNSSSDGMIGVVVAGGPTSNYNYNWANGGTNSGASGLNSGAYDITVSSGACSVSGGVTLTDPGLITITAIANTSVSCNGASDGSITIAASGGPSGYTYIWSGNQTTAAITGITSGINSITVMSGTCNSIGVYTVTEPAAISLSVTVTDATSAGATDGTATAVVGVASSYTYLWNNAGQVAQTATGLGAGTATVTITEVGGNNCSQVASGVVTDPASCNMTLTLNGTAELCNGASDGSVTSTTVGGPSTLYTYTWSNSATDASISGVPGGVYTLVVNSGSCTVTETVTITDITGANAGIGGAILDQCDNAGIFDTVDPASLLGGTPDGGGSWTDVDGSGAFFFGMFSPSAAGAGTWNFSYLVDDGNSTSCSLDSAMVTIVVHAAPNDGGDASVSACVAASSLNLAAELSNPDAGGMWLDLDATGALTDSIFDVSGVTIGDYNVAYAVPGNAGCEADTAFIAVQIVSTPNAGISGTIDACDDEFTLDPANGLGGSPDAGGDWIDVDGSGAFFFGNFSPTLAGAGDWDFTYTVSAAGCPDASATVTVVVNASPNAGANGVDTVCFDLSSLDLMATLGGTPDAGGIWSDDDGSGALTGSVFAPDNAGIGVYNFTYTVAGISPCVDASSSVEITVDLCAGINNASAVMLAELYPNPSTGLFTLMLKGWDLNTTLVLISGIDGRELYQQSVSSSNELIEWENASAGIYFVTIKQNDNVVVKQLIIE